METLQALLDKIEQGLQKVYEHAKVMVSKISMHKASPNMVKDILVNYHDVPTPVHQIATINTSDASTLQVVPWEKKLLHEIEKAIVKNNQHDLTAQNTGETIRVCLPPLTEERRVQLVEKVKAEIEKTKVRVRTERQAGKNTLKELKKNGLSEDEIKKGKEDLQKLADKYIQNLEQLQKDKTKDLMSI